MNPRWASMTPGRVKSVINYERFCLASVNARFPVLLIGGLFESSGFEPSWCVAAADLGAGPLRSVDLLPGSKEASASAFALLISAIK